MKIILSFISQLNYHLNFTINNCNLQIYFFIYILISIIEFFNQINCFYQLLNLSISFEFYYWINCFYQLLNLNLIVLFYNFNQNFRILNLIQGLMFFCHYLHQNFWIPILLQGFIIDQNNFQVILRFHYVDHLLN